MEGGGERDDLDFFLLFLPKEIDNGWSNAHIRRL